MLFFSFCLYALIYLCKIKYDFKCFLVFFIYLLFSFIYDSYIYLISRVMQFSFFPFILKSYKFTLHFARKWRVSVCLRYPKGSVCVMLIACLRNKYTSIKFQNKIHFSIFITSFLWRSHSVYYKCLQKTYKLLVSIHCIHSYAFN